MGEKIIKDYILFLKFILKILLFSKQEEDI